MRPVVAEPDEISRSVRTAAGIELSDEQANTLQALVGSRDVVNVVDAGQGTGKTTMLETFGNILEREFRPDVDHWNNDGSQGGGHVANPILDRLAGIGTIGFVAIARLGFDSTIVDGLVRVQHRHADEDIRIHPTCSTRPGCPVFGAIFWLFLRYLLSTFT